MYKCQSFSWISRKSLGPAGPIKNSFYKRKQSVPRGDVVKNTPFYYWESWNFSSAPSVFWERWQWCLLNSRWQRLERVFRKSKSFWGNCPNPSAWKQRTNEIYFPWELLVLSFCTEQTKLCLPQLGRWAMWDMVLDVWKSKCCLLSAQLQFGLLSLPWVVERLCLFLSSLCSVSHTSLLNIWY